MPLANTTAADLLNNQIVRDKLIPVLQDFQELSQAKSRITRGLDGTQADVTALIDALLDAGADLTPTP